MSLSPDKKDLCSTLVLIRIFEYYFKSVGFLYVHIEMTSPDTR